MKPLGATAISVEATDDQLVAWAQEGSSEAFALLFRRYRPAIGRYVCRILGDEGRAEDIVQEVFLSALRSIGSLDRPAGFKPWLYRIAHNTCVDHIRRSGRAEEVHLDANMLPASEEIRLFRQAPSTHAAVSQKEDFKNLREALGGLPPSQSEVLVMRELEGLSYDQIAARMGITRGAVESMLFRARQGLRDEYGQIATGQRCLRMRPVMARMAEGMGGLRDRRSLARHVRGCQSCRRDAFAMGLGGPALEAPTTGLRGGLSRVAALLPLPWLIHRRPDGSGAASSAGGGGSALAAHAHTVTNFTATAGVGADHAATAIQKAVAVAAAVAVVSGGGIVAGQRDNEADLLLKPDSSAVPARAEAFGPKVPPALRQLGTSPTGAPLTTAVTPPAAAATGAPAGSPTAPAPQLTTPGPAAGAPSAPSGTPTAPAGSAPAGSAPGTGTPDSGPAPDTSAPAAGPAPSDTSDGGSSTGGGSLDAGGGGSGGGGDGGTAGGGTGGGTGVDTGGGGGGAGGGAPPGPAGPSGGCDLPPGLEKKDKITPGQAKRCAKLEAAGSSLGAAG